MTTVRNAVNSDHVWFAGEGNMPRGMNMRTLWIGIMMLFIFSGAALRAETGPVVLSIGGNAWYSDWRPPWRDSRRVLTVPFFSPVKNQFGFEYPYSFAWKINPFKIPMGAMGGPSLSINILNRVSLSSVFTIGKFNAVSRGPALPIFIDTKYSRDILKYDSDSTVSVVLHKYVRLFAGFKYQGYDYEEKMRFMVTFGNGGGYAATGTAAFRNYGPGLGLNVSAPLYQTLYLIISSSASYLFSTASYDFKYSVLIPGLSPEWGRYRKDRMKSVSNNNTISLAYSIGSSGVTLALGFRHQMLYYWQKSKATSFINYNGKYEHFLGGSFSVIYSINLVRQSSNT